MSGNDESSANTPPAGNPDNGSGRAGGGGGGTIDFANFFGIFKNELTEQNLMLLIGIMVVLIFVIVISIGVKVFCCQDKRKFRSSKDVKCVRHQESMTSPLDSPLRSVISMTAATAANNANLSEQQQHLQQQQQQQRQLEQQRQQLSEQTEHLINSRTQNNHPNESGIEMQKFATLPTPTVRSSTTTKHENENGRILRGSVDVPPPSQHHQSGVGGGSSSSVWKTSSAMNVNSPTKPQRTRKRSESSIGSAQNIMGRHQTQLKAQVHHQHHNHHHHDGGGDEKAPKGNIAEVTIPSNIAVQLNEEMKSKLSAIKDPGKTTSTTQQQQQRPPAIKPPSSSVNLESNCDPPLRLPQQQKSTYSTTSNALTSSEINSTQSSNHTNTAAVAAAADTQSKSNHLPRMWFVSLDNITPEPVYRGHV